MTGHRFHDFILSGRERDALDRQVRDYEERKRRKRELRMQVEQRAQEGQRAQEEQ